MNIAEKRERMLDLVTETVEYYCNNPRSLVTTGGANCAYRNPNGAMCAVGRLLTEEEMALWSVDGCNTAPYQQNVSKLGVPKALEGLSTLFIIRLQNLHDVNGNWQDSSLTFYGQSELKFFKEAIEQGAYDL